jgi:hypothetical protein
MLRVGIPNLASETFPRQTASLLNSPIVLDYTYYLDPPSNETISDLSQQLSYSPRYKKGSVFLFVWDAALDVLKPIQVCAVRSGKEICKDINEPSLKCREEDRGRAFNCSRSNNIGGNRYFPPYLESHFVPQDFFGVNCLSKVSYTTKRGREIVVQAKYLIGGFRRSMDSEIEKLMDQCGYDLQIKSAKTLKSEDKPPIPAFASANRADTPVTYNRNNCERLGRMIFRANNLGDVLVRHRMNTYRFKVANVMKTLPEIPAYENYGGRFDESDNKCKMDLVMKGEPYNCTVAGMVTSKWLPVTAPVKTSSMISYSEIWNGGVFPDPNSLIDCVRAKASTDERLPKKTTPKMVTLDQVQLLENSTMADQLEAFGAGNNSNCATPGYTEIIFRISIDLGLRSIEKNICSTDGLLRKTKLETGLNTSAKQLNGCFTAEGMLSYSKKANELLMSASKDCSSSLGQQAKEYAKKAAEWAVEQP